MTLCSVVSVWYQVPLALDIPSFFADRHWFQWGSRYGSGSSVFCQCGSGSRVLMNKNWKKFTAEKKIFFCLKMAIYLSLGLHKGSLSPSRSLHPSKENIWHFKTWIFFGSGSGSVFPIRIRIQLTKMKVDPCGSGSATLDVPYPIIWLLALIEIDTGSCCATVWSAMEYFTLSHIFRRWI